MSKRWSGTLSCAPIPTWANLFRSLLRKPLPDVDLASPWCREGDMAGWLSRSSWSLALIALWRKNKEAPSATSVWLPDYFCNASLEALRQTGVKLWFYPVTTDLAPDIAACRVQVVEGCPSVFVLVHYFGKPTPLAAAREFCAQHGAWLVEDAVHALRPVQGIGMSGDFVLYSPHKHLPIPDGAVLVIRSGGPTKLGTNGVAAFGPPEQWPNALSGLEKRLCSSHLWDSVRVVIWVLKRLLQRLGVRSSAAAAPPFTELSPTRFVAPAQVCASRASRVSRRLLTTLVETLPSVARLRQRHQLIWDELLFRKIPEGASLAAAERPMLREWVPYLAAYRLSPESAPGVYESWWRDGLCATTWPDMPPEVASNPEGHSNAWLLRHTRIYLPVHQSLAMRAIAQRYSQSLAREELPHVRTVWDGAEPGQWAIWIAQCKRSNLLQTWAYGEAKAVAESWRIRRAVFYFGGEPVAVAQVLEKRVAKLLTIFRINRGPVLLRSLTNVEERSLWRQIGKLGCIWQGRVLAVAPEVPLSGAALILLDECGLRQFSSIAPESVWVDLTPSLEHIREQLNGKWRNMLVSAEKAGLNLEIGDSDDLFEWMIEKYECLMEVKNFSGAGVGLLRALRKRAGQTEKLLVLRAMNGSDAVAGICLAWHGSAATYLLGWNGEAGRMLKANQFLLWQAIRYLKNSGAYWFDLGGVSEEDTPGIAAFKLGLNGERYELVGEYWKW